jgi:hypothetical protein
MPFVTIFELRHNISMEKDTKGIGEKEKSRRSFEPFLNNFQIKSPIINFLWEMKLNLIK